MTPFLPSGVEGTKLHPQVGTARGVMRVAWLLVVLSTSSCKPECEQPLEAYCREAPCRPLESWTAASGHYDGGACPNFGRATCGEYAVIFGGDDVVTEQFYAPDGGLEGVRRSPGAAGVCATVFGTVPDCTRENETRYCATR